MKNEKETVEEQIKETVEEQIKETVEEQIKDTVEEQIKDTDKQLSENKEFSEEQSVKQAAETVSADKNKKFDIKDKLNKLNKFNIKDKAKIMDAVKDKAKIMGAVKDKANSVKNIDMNNFKENVSNKVFDTATFKKINKLDNEKKFFGFIIIVLLLVIVFQGVLNFNLITANRTIVLPPAITKEFWATDKHISESYFEQIGFYIADRVLSVSPETVDSSYISLLPFFDSGSQNLKAVREKLREQAEFVKSENMYQIFYPLHMYPDYAKKQLKIEGPMKKFIGEMLVHESDKAYIIINYEVKSGRFMVKSLDFKYK